MSHGEGVIFCQKAEGRAALPLLIDRAEGGFHSAHPMLDLKAVFLQIVLKKPAGLKFLTADFRQVINSVRKRFQLCADLIHILSDFFFHIYLQAILNIQ